MENFQFLNVLKDLNEKNSMTSSFITKRLRKYSHEDGHILYKNLKIPYLSMDIPPFDYEAMLSEAMNLEYRSIPHRSDDSQGWNSICLHGIEAHKTKSPDIYGYPGEQETPYKWTWASKKAPVTTKYLKTLLQSAYFSNFYRIRFMYLKPGGFIKFHRDREEGRSSLGPLNLALNMPEDCYWLFEKWGSVPFHPGTSFAVDVSNSHGVWNLSKQTRIHIIIHGIYGEQYYRTIKRSVEKSLKNRSYHQESPISKKQPCSDIACLLWLQSNEVRNSELLRTVTNITEHFAKLRANRSIGFDSGVSLTSLLSKAHKAEKKWAIVITPGTILKSDFYQEVREALSRAKPNVFMFAHILDRKQRWFGIHPQFFIINLHLWNKICQPPILKKSKENMHLPAVIRSPENIHDDYTPLYLYQGSETKKENPQVFGWHWIQKALEENLRVENIPHGIRQKKLFLYPEQNSEILLKHLASFSGKNNETNEDEIKTLSKNQRDIMDYLCDESKGLAKKTFIFNTEITRYPRSEKTIQKIDAFVGLPSGFMDLHVLYRHGFDENTRLIYFDINPSILHLKQNFLDKFDRSQNYADFIRQTFNEYSEKTKKEIFLTTPLKEAKNKWEQELELWGGEDLFFEHLKKIQNLKREFLNLNLLNDFNPLTKTLETLRKKHIALWYSNCFNYTPGLAHKNWKLEEIKQQGISFLNNILWIAEKNHLQVTIYGENISKGFLTSFGTEIRDIFN